jgi:two-component system LytT family sensor kinase
MAKHTALRIRNLLLYLGVWTLIALFFGTQLIFYGSYGATQFHWAPALLAVFVNWYLWAALAPAVFWLGRRFEINRTTWRQAVPIHIIAGITMSGIKILLRVWIGQILPFIPTSKPLGVFSSQFHDGVLAYWLILGAWHAATFYQRYVQRERTALQLESRLAQAQLEVLRTQLHPHFLFNTLHAISVLVREHSNDAADRMITLLSDLLRMTLENAGAQEVTLAQELEVLERYLEIQKTRFGERLHVAYEIDQQNLDALVPNLMLQPLVENAIRHGISQRAEGGSIEISAAAEGSWLNVRVRDDGPGLPAGVFQEGLGLMNTRARLEHLYGPDHNFVLTARPGGGLTVGFTIPLHRPAPTRPTDTGHFVSGDERFVSSSDRLVNSL